MECASERAGGRFPSEGVAYRIATRIVRGWFDVYGRGLNPHWVRRRRQQLDFVLWEHADATDAHGHPAAAAELRMVLLTVLGVSGDLAWRRGVRRGAAPWLFPAPVQLVPNRLKRRLWVPLHRGHVFDQTNGLFAHPEPGGAAVIFD